MDQLPRCVLEDYRLACRTAGIKDDYLIIHFLPIHLVEGARVRLRHLPDGTIHDYADLRKVFDGIFRAPTSD